jgi:Protein of unknown function (DUF3572)
LRPKVAAYTRVAEDIALKYMVYLASDGDKLAQFCGQSGLDGNELKTRLTDPAFQGFLLDYLLQDESELLAFAAEASLKPESIMIARSKLPGFAE